MQLVPLLHVGVEDVVDQLCERLREVFGAFDVAVDDLQHLLFVGILTNWKVW